MGIEALTEPLLSIHPRHQELPRIVSELESVQAVVTTSFQAISILAQTTDLRDFPLWCVGMDSAQKAQQLGFSKVYASQGNAETLKTDLMRQLEPSSGKIIHLSGEMIRVDITEHLCSEGFDATRHIIYDAREATEFQPTTIHSLKNNHLEAVLFYSPRTAEVFGELCFKHKLEESCQNLVAFCFSDQIAQSAKVLPWKEIITSSQTTTENFIETVKHYLLKT